MTETVFTEVVLRHREQPDKYLTSRGTWSEFENAKRYNSQEDLVRTLLRESDLVVKRLVSGEIVKVVTRETIEDVEPLKRSHFNAVNTANDIINIKSIHNLPGLVAGAYEAYHIRGGPKKNTYHYAMLVMTEDLRKFVRDLSDEERVEMFEYRGYSSIYSGTVSEYLKCMLKPLGLKHPTVAWWSDLGLFKRQSDMVMFKLQYGMTFHTFDFKWIYEEFQNHGMKSRPFDFDRKSLNCQIYDDDDDIDEYDGDGNLI